MELWKACVAATMLACVPAIAAAQQVAGRPGEPAFFEFGKVLEVGQDSVEIQTNDEQTHRPLRQRFVLNREARADVVRTGDPVEVIYTVEGGELKLRRLLVLWSGVPRPGQPTAAELAESARQASAPAGQAAASAAVATGRPAPVTRPQRTHTSAPVAPVQQAALPKQNGSGKAVPATRTVDLSARTIARTPSATEVPLGIAGGYGKPAPVPVTRAFNRDEPSAECNRSDADWPNHPVRIAVLDFRYPTEREEQHDIGKTGGGSGTAVGDMVFSRLEGLHQYEMVRGDRRRLDRSDIAGAARLGRELGADAVLEGTFLPIEGPVGPDGEAPRVTGYSFTAGLVDTCTGQVLVRMKADSCAALQGSTTPATGLDTKACTDLSVSARDAEDPDSHSSAFGVPLDALLYPLEHNQTPSGLAGAAVGTVTGAQGANVFVHLSGGGVRVGDQLALHAARLTKNPATYTLMDLRNQEIGRVQVKSVQGNTVTGTYAGEVVPRAGDVVEAVTE